MATINIIIMITAGNLMDNSHTHGAVDPTLRITQRGIWAIKRSFVGLLATAAARTQRVAASVAAIG